jgi:hypothetical protein
VFRRYSEGAVPVNVVFQRSQRNPPPEVLFPCPNPASALRPLEMLEATLMSVEPSRPNYKRIAAQMKKRAVSSLYHAHRDPNTYRNLFVESQMGGLCWQRAFIQTGSDSWMSRLTSAAMAEVGDRERADRWSPHSPPVSG